MFPLITILTAGGPSAREPISVELRQQLRDMHGAVLCQQDLVERLLECRLVGADCPVKYAAGQRPPPLS
jgi:hypothetical protein